MVPRVLKLYMRVQEPKHRNHARIPPSPIGRPTVRRNRCICKSDRQPSGILRTSRCSQTPACFNYRDKIYAQSRSPTPNQTLDTMNRLSTIILCSSTYIQSNLITMAIHMQASVKVFLAEKTRAYSYQSVHYEECIE